MTDNQQTDPRISQIQKDVLEWTQKNVSQTFTFRPNQFETIVGIVYSIVYCELENNIIQAPTGTGKSFICIISAGVLADYYEKTCYILASDLYLWKQYADAIDKFKLRNFGYMKGSLGNYRCEYGQCDYEIGECKQKQYSLSKFRKDKAGSANKWPCSTRCQYLLDRFRAEKTPVTLMTYQLWLYQMNLVRNEDPDEGFAPRDVIFCDECHNIPDIISRFAQPVISVEYDRQKLVNIAQYALDHNLELPWIPRLFTKEYQEKYRLFNKTTFKNVHKNISVGLDLNKVGTTFEYITDCLTLATSTVPIRTRTHIKIDILKEYVSFLDDMAQLVELCKQDYNRNASDNDDGMTPGQKRRKNRNGGVSSTISSELTQHENISGSLMENNWGKKKSEGYLKMFNWFHNYASSFEEYINAVVEAGAQYVIIEKTVNDREMPTYTFYCVKEDYLCNQYLLSKAKYKVMTSATVGNIQSFIMNIGIDISKLQEKPNLVAYTTLPNIFDFSKSPIFYLPTYKMNYNEKRNSFPKICDIVYKICEMYPEAHGMINTGSYMNSRTILATAPYNIKNRLIGYDTAKDKTEQIKRFKSIKGSILIGPSLVEGVDLPDDLCRFIIIVKLPYPNISSPMIKAKINLFPLWYNSTTSNTMIQNIGRGVRSEGDWAHTYILDGCFDSLYNQTYTQYAPEIQARFVRVTPEYIEQQYQQFKSMYD